MASLVLGATPGDLTVNLIRDADFVTTLALTDEDGAAVDYPDTATITLVFNDDDDTTWTADITDDEASWDVDKAEVDTLIDALPTSPSARIWYVDGSTDLLWFAGPVLVRDGW